MRTGMQIATFMRPPTAAELATPELLANSIYRLPVDHDKAASFGLLHKGKVFAIVHEADAPNHVAHVLALTWKVRAGGWTIPRPDQCRFQPAPTDLVATKPNSHRVEPSRVKPDRGQPSLIPGLNFKRHPFL